MAARAPSSAMTSPRRTSSATTARASSRQAGPAEQRVELGRLAQPKLLQHDLVGRAPLEHVQLAPAPSPGSGGGAAGAARPPCHRQSSRWATARDDEQVALRQCQSACSRIWTHASCPARSPCGPAVRLRRRLRGAGVKVTGMLCANGRGARQSAAAGVHEPGRPQQPGVEDLAALKLVGRDAGQVDGDAGAGRRRSTLRLCDWSPRILARRPLGWISTSWPTRSSPSTSVPVTTVPNPAIVKTRSIGRRGGRSMGGRARC